MGKETLMDATRKAMRHIMLGEVFGKPITFAWAQPTAMFSEHPDRMHLLYQGANPAEVLFADNHGREWNGIKFTVRSLKEFRSSLVNTLIDFRRAFPTESLVLVYQRGMDWRPLGTGVMPGDEQRAIESAAQWYEKASEAHKSEYTELEPDPEEYEYEEEDDLSMPDIVDVGGNPSWIVKGFDIDWDEVREEGHDPESDIDITSKLADEGWFEDEPEMEFKIWLGELNGEWHYTMSIEGDDDLDYHGDGPYRSEDAALQAAIDEARSQIEDAGMVAY
jgi:hypothetical protein